MLESLGERPPALRELASAGEPLNPEVIEIVRAARGIRDGYGQTETTAQVGNPPGFDVRLGSMGKPLPGYELALLDADGRECDEGELAIRLAGARPIGLMDGYGDDADLTAAAMAGGYYRTGDEARRDADGYIHFVGRGDDVFKSSDYRISPFERARRAPAGREGRDRAEPRSVRLSVPKAFVVVTPGTAETEGTARAIFRYCTDKLAPYKRVRRLEFAPLPKTISGKIRRVDLRRLEATRRERERGTHEFWLDELTS